MNAAAVLVLPADEAEAKDRSTCAPLSTLQLCRMGHRHLFVIFLFLIFEHDMS